MSPFKYRRLWRQAITGLSMALFAGVATAAIPTTPFPECPPINGAVNESGVFEILDVDFREDIAITGPDGATFNVWSDADGEKTYRAPGSNLTLAASPKLGWSSANGLGSKNDALDGPSETLTIGTYWTPETVSGICVSNLSAGVATDLLGTITITYIYTVEGEIFDGTCPEGTRRQGDFCIVEDTIDIFPGSQSEISEILFEFDEPLLITSAVFTTSGSRVAFSVAGLKLSREATVTCTANCTNEDQAGVPTEPLIRTGEFNTRVLNLEDNSGFSTTHKLNEVVTFSEAREECFDPAFASGCSEPRGLVLDFESKTSFAVCESPVDAATDPFDPENDLGPRQVLLSGDWCGIEVLRKDGSGETDRVVRVADSDSTYTGITRELIEGTIKYLVPRPDGTLPECRVMPTDPVFLWTPKLGPADREVPVLKDVTTGEFERALLDVTIGCGSSRGYSLRSWNAWQVEPSDAVDFEGVFVNHIALMRTALEQTRACTTNGDKTSTLSSNLNKVERYFLRAEYPRTVSEIESFLAEINSEDTIADFSQCYWNFEDKATQFGPVPEQDTAPAAYNAFLNGLAGALTYQVCARFAPSQDADMNGLPDSWGDPVLTEACGLLLPPSP